MFVYGAQNKKRIFMVMALNGLNIIICLVSIIYLLASDIFLPKLFTLLLPLAGSLVLSLMDLKSAKAHNKCDLCFFMILSTVFVIGKNNNILTF